MSLCTRLRAFLPCTRINVATPPAISSARSVAQHQHCGDSTGSPARNPANLPRRAHSCPSLPYLTNGVLNFSGGVVPLVLALWDEETLRIQREEKVHVEVHNQRRVQEEEMESWQLVEFVVRLGWS